MSLTLNESINLIVPPDTETPTLKLPRKVQKRNGSYVDFNISRIRKALELCYDDFSPEEPPPLTPVSTLIAAVKNSLHHKFGGKAPSVEDIQDIVEMALISNGEFVAAHRYIRYRELHAKGRVDIPQEVVDAFAVDAQYFPTELQRFQFYDKYSRFNWDLMRRETWPETVDRVVDYYHYLADGKLSEDIFEVIRNAMLHQEAMSSMRCLAMAGPAAIRNSMSIYNCFAGTEKFVTPIGPQAFIDTVGTTQTILNGDGKWATADIRSFGVQPLQEITFRPGSGKSLIRHHVKATPSHRWHTLNRGEVTDLRVGDQVAFVGATPTSFIPEAWIAGFGFGDGTIEVKGQAKVRLCGEKDAQWVRIFEEFGHNSICYPPSYNGDAVVVFHKGWFSDWKKLPSLDKGAEWLASWLEGYLAADGHKGDQPGLDSQNNEAIEFVMEIAPLCGYMVTGRNTSSVIETNYGVRKAALQRITMRTSGVWWVTAIEDLEVEQEVFCAVVPDTHDFVLANGIHTGNCSFLFIDSIDALAEIMLVSLAGCGVGYSVEREHVEKFPRIKRQTGERLPIFQIEDSAEGWAEAVRFGLRTWFDGKDVEFDPFEVELHHPMGTPLKIKGGRASGSAPLMEVLAFCRKMILGRQGSFLRSIDAHDLSCVIGGAAVSGGVRRTALIALFDYDDYEMRTCKDGAKLEQNPWRWNANNSAVWPDTVTQLDLMQQFTTMYDNHRGEPGIFSREAANRTKPERRAKGVYGSNPCGEIILRSRQFCNLSIAVARPDDTLLSLAEKVEIAAIIGTIQSLATDFPNMRPEWKKNCEEERLLGVDIIGERDCPLFYGDSEDVAARMEFLREVAVSTNVKIAKALNINPSTAVTCNKPGGNSSVFLNASSGTSAGWSEFYIRNVRVNSYTPIYKVLKACNVPMDPENGQVAETANTWVAHFPVKAPEGAKTRKDFTALDQCEFWKLNKLHWTEHNPSTTITYQPDEMIPLTQWVWDNKEIIGGMAFLPADDAEYAQMPYEEITEEEYERLSAEFPPIDFSLLYEFERTDMTTASQEVACLANGGCEV